MTATTQQPPRSIQYHLKHRGKPERRIDWITSDGEHHTITGMVTGWARSPKGGLYLTVSATTGFSGRGVRQSETRYVGAKAIQRWMDANGVTWLTDEEYRATRGERCPGCGKVLGTGPNGHLDEFSGLEGVCYDCV